MNYYYFAALTFHSDQLIIQLKCLGVNLDESLGTITDPELLMEVMEIRLKLEEANEAELEQLNNENKKRLLQCYEEIGNYSILTSLSLSFVCVCMCGTERYVYACDSVCFFTLCLSLCLTHHTITCNYITQKEKLWRRRTQRQQHKKR